MKSLKIMFAIMAVVGYVGISQAFACKTPAFGSLQMPRGSNARSIAVSPEPVVTKDNPDIKKFSNHDLNGRYASFAQATFFDGSRTEYATCVGVVTFDGRGQFTDSEVHSYDGVLVTDQFTGTYTVNSDGSGTMHYVGVGTDETYDQQIVLSNQGNEITFLVMLDIPGLVSQGSMKKQ